MKLIELMLVINEAYGINPDMDVWIYNDELEIDLPATGAREIDGVFVIES